MKTIIYFVRHAESPYVAGMERARGLSVKGMEDAVKVRDALIREGIDFIVSSPYQRAIQTVKNWPMPCGSISRSKKI